MKLLGPDEFSDSMNALRNGNEKVFKEFYNEFYPRLHYFAQGIIKNEQEAEDIAANVFLTLHRELNAGTNFEDGAKFKAWLFVIARNKCLTYLTTNKTHNRIHQEMIKYMEQTDPGKDHYIAQAEVIEEVMREIQKLPPGEQRIFRLAHIEGLSNGQIAGQLCISVDTVKNAKKSAMAKLRAVFANEPLVLIVLFGIGAD
jgi:RNA polymerase sigma-70 factor (family 1)